MPAAAANTGGWAGRPCHEDGARVPRGSIHAFDHSRREAAERADVAAAVPGVRLAGRAADGFVALEEAGDKSLARERRQAHAAGLAVLDELPPLWVVWIDHFEHRARLRGVVNDFVSLV